MPQKKRKMNFQGEEVEVVSMPFQTAGEHWNEYLLDDGSVLRVKIVVTEVMRVEDKYDGQGNPIYITNSTNIVTASSPDNLRKDGG